jgi:hypothetical protein
VKDEIREFVERRWKALGFIATFTVAQLFIVAAKWGRPLIWDSNVYTGMGKVIFSGGKYGLWESFRPVAMPMVSGFLWFLGIPMRNFPRLVAVLFAVTTLAVFYRFAKDRIGREKALTGLLLLGSAFIFVKWSNHFLTGIPASALILVSIYLVYRKNFYIAGLTSSLAFLTRFPAAIIGPAVMLFLIYKLYRDREVKNFLEKYSYYAGGVLTLAVPFLIFNQVMYADPFHPLISGALVPAGNPDSYLFGLWYLIESLGGFYLVLAASLILAPVGMYSALENDTEKHLLPAVVLVLLYGFFSMYPHKELRFLLIMLPLIAYFASAGVHFLASHLSGYIGGRENLSVNIFRIAVVIGLLAGSFGVYSVNTWQDQDRREFVEKAGELNGAVVSNTPAIVPYGDFRFVPVRPENLYQDRVMDVNSCTSEKRTGFCKVYGENIDYVVLRQNSWYCTPAIENCEGKIEEFESQVEKDFELIYNVSNSVDNYRIYRRD